MWKMSRNTKNNPLYMKKSKAAKLRELERDEYYRNYILVNSTTDIINSPEKEKKQHIFPNKGRTRQIRYADYEDDFNEREYDNNKVRRMYEMEEDISEYTIDDRRYNHPDPEYYQSEFEECSHSDCSEECNMSEPIRRRRASHLWDYDYTGRREHGQSRGDSEWWSPAKSSPIRHRDHSESEHRTPYANNKYIYLARQPSGHPASWDKKVLEHHESPTSAENKNELDHLKSNDENSITSEYTMRYENQTEDYQVYQNQYEGKSKNNVEYSYNHRDKIKDSKDSGQYKELPYNKRGRHHQYQVYATQVEDKPGAAFEQQQSGPIKKELSLSMMGLKNSSLSQSSMVLLPVIVLESGSQQQENRIMSTKELRRGIKENAEKPLETDMEVYAATNLEKGNIFKKEQEILEAEGENLAKRMQNISVYTVNQDGHFLQEKKSGRTLEETTKTQNASSSSIIKYPVKKSYINVSSPKRSRSTNSLIGSTSEGRYKGSGFFSKAYKKDKKLQALKKKKSKNKIVNDYNSSDIDPKSNVSIINLKRREKEHQERQEEKNTKKSEIKDKDVNGIIYLDDATIKSMKYTGDGNKNNKESHSRKSLTKIKQNNKAQITKENAKEGATDKGKRASIWNIQPTKHPSSKGLKRNKSVNRQSSNSNRIRQSDEHDIKSPYEAIQKSKSLEVLSNSKDEIRQSTTLKPVKSQQSLESVARKNKMVRSIFRKKKISSPVIGTNISQSSIHNANKHGYIKRIPSKEISFHRPETRMTDKNPIPITILGYDCSFLLNVFNAAIIFLGMDMHGSMLKILNCSEE